MTPKVDAHKLLGLPDSNDLIENWTHEQKRDYLLAQLYTDGCQMHGPTCARICNLERWRTWMVGVAAGVVGFSGIGLWMLYAVGAFKGDKP